MIMRLQPRLHGGCTMGDPQMFLWMRSLMAFLAICLVLHIKGPFTVVARAAEHAFVYLAHIHLIGVLLHLEQRVMTGTTLLILSFNMPCMAEEH